MDNKYHWSDNICAKHCRSHIEYFEADFRSPEDEQSPSVSLRLYQVPGRFATYTFDYVPGGSDIDYIQYHSETDTTLPKALLMLQKDLDKKQVVTMLVNACARRGNCGYARTMVEKLIAVLVPKAKVVRLMKKACTKRFAEIHPALIKLPA